MTDCVARVLRFRAESAASSPLGVNHEQLSYSINGLDVKLTGVEGSRLIEEILNTSKS